MKRSKRNADLNFRCHSLNDANGISSSNIGNAKVGQLIILRLDLPSTLICHGNGASWKRSSNGGIRKCRLFATVFSVEENILKTELSEIDDVRIIMWLTLAYPSKVHKSLFWRDNSPFRRSQNRWIQYCTRTRSRGKFGLEKHGGLVFFFRDLWFCF